MAQLRQRHNWKVQRHCKDFLDRNNIPTAFYGVFTEVDLAVEYVKEKGVPIVIKADGLAAGKGVIIANTQQEATDAIHDMLEGNRFVLFNLMFSV